MSEDPQEFIDHSVRSDCCDAPALGEIDAQGFGLCAACHDHAHFIRNDAPPPPARARAINALAPT